MSQHQPSKNLQNDTMQGILVAFVAFLMWGLFPFYFKQLTAYNATEVIVHRIVWTFALLGIFIVITRRNAAFIKLRQRPRWLGLTLLAALLIAVNWLTYVWAVAHDQILEASLGYFINPLTGVLLSLIVLKETLRKLQKLAVALAALAVLVQLVWLGGLPWVSLVLAFSFSIYGLIQKKTPFDAIDGLFLETALLLPLALIWLSLADVASSRLDFWLSPEIWLLMLSGPITLLPLLLFNKSTKMLSYTLLSFMGYLSPSIVFLLAVFYYQEPFSWQNMLVFGLIWVALVIFSVDIVQEQRKKGKL